MVTPRRPHRGHRLGLPWAARLWLLGRRPYFDAAGELRNSGIVRLQHLIVRARTEEDWQKYLAELQDTWGPLVRAREARKAARAAAAARKALREEAAPRSPPT
jgi:hypothetical protein